MYQITQESLEKIRQDMQSRMRPWELEMAGVTREKFSINEMPKKYTQVQGEAGFIELVARTREKGS
jgi:hypothetical protein